MLNSFFKKYAKLLSICILSVFVISFIFLKFLINSSASGKGQEIPVAMALDDGYTYPTIVAITSIMENANPINKYNFYIMHPDNFNQENKDRLMSLEKKYNKCCLNLINMENSYKNANDKGRVTTPAYYRLSLSDLLPELDKIIWLDGDVLAFKDLKEMYDVDMKGHYYKGFLDDNIYGVKDFVENDHCICSGVMVINLKELREDDIVEKFEKFIEENNDRLIQHDQTTINAVAYKKIGKLSLRYGIFNYYYDFKLLQNYRDKLLAKDRYSDDEIVDGLNNLVVVHCVNKPWKYKNAGFFKEWWGYAKKTDFYKEIKSAYPID